MTDYSMLKDYIKALSDNSDNLAFALITLISVNIVLEVIRFLGKVKLSNKDRNNKKQLLIDEKRVKIIEQLFQSMDRLSLYDKNQSSEMLADIKEISQFMTKNKLYISKKFRSRSNEILDYFKNVMSDYRLKDIKKETSLFDKFCNEFEK